eukprot:3113832-Amphidinium_carterae.2
MGCRTENCRREKSLRQMNVCTSFPRTHCLRNGFCHLSFASTGAEKGYQNIAPSLASKLAEAMVDVYGYVRSKFTIDEQVVRVVIAVIMPARVQLVPIAFKNPYP